MAATKEFADRGYGGATTAAIARRAGVTQPLVHHHFGSKEGLWSAVLSDLFEDLSAMILRSTIEAEGMSRLGRLAHIVRAFVVFSGRRPELARLLRTESAAGGAPFREIFDRWLQPPIEFVREELRAAIQEGAVREVHPGFSYFMIVGISTQAFAEPATALRAFDLDMTDPDVVERYADFVVSVIMRGIALDTPPVVAAPHAVAS